MTIKWDREQAKEVKEELSLQQQIGNCPNCGAPARILQDPYINPERPNRDTGDILVTCSAECWRTDPQAYIDAVRALS